MSTLKGGCFLINRDSKEVAVIFRKKLNDYSFPKGHMEKGEDVKACAIRETIEETGHDVKLILDEPVFVNKYTTPAKEEVECYFYLAEDMGEYKGEIAEEDREICEWMPIENVRAKITYDDVIAMWDEVKPIIEKYI